jgi:hypothetical protein
MSSSQQVVVGSVSELQANTPTSLLEYGTNEVLVLPATAALHYVKITREGSQGLTSGVNLSLGYSGNIGSIINGTLSTSSLNSSGCATWSSNGLTIGLTSSQQVYVQSDAGVTGDLIVFEIGYFSDDAAQLEFLSQGRNLFRSQRN